MSKTVLEQVRQSKERQQALEKELQNLVGQYREAREQMFITAQAPRDQYGEILKESYAEVDGKFFKVNYTDDGLIERMSPLKQSDFVDEGGNMDLAKLETLKDFDIIVYEQVLDNTFQQDLGRETYKHTAFTRGFSQEMLSEYRNAPRVNEAMSMVGGKPSVEWLNKNGYTGGFEEMHANYENRITEGFKQAQYKITPEYQKEQYDKSTQLSLEIKEVADFLGQPVPQGVE